MKKLILAVLVMATFGANATQLTKEQQARVDKFNEGWTSLLNVLFLFPKPNGLSCSCLSDNIICCLSKSLISATSLSISWVWEKETRHLVLLLTVLNVLRVMPLTVLKRLMM
jgi:hypothetical protein